MPSGNCCLPVNQHSKNWFDLSKSHYWPKLLLSFNALSLKQELSALRLKSDQLNSSFTSFKVCYDPNELCQATKTTTYTIIFQAMSPDHTLASRWWTLMLILCCSTKRYCDTIALLQWWLGRWTVWRTVGMYIAWCCVRIVFNLP